MSYNATIHTRREIRFDKVANADLAKVVAWLIAQDFEVVSTEYGGVRGFSRVMGFDMKEGAYVTID